MPDGVEPIDLWGAIKYARRMAHKSIIKSESGVTPVIVIPGMRQSLFWYRGFDGVSQCLAKKTYTP